MQDPIQDKHIIVGVCGGIAAYKAADFVRLLTNSGANVSVVMTKAAQAFVGPLTFETLSGNPVWTDLFGGHQSHPLRHIEWADKADATVVIPATANIIGKIAHGIADDPLTTFILAAKKPILVCPSMNSRMYENPVVQDNIKRLSDADVKIVEPDAGLLASGDVGIGRLPAVEAIGESLRCLLSRQDLAEERILITAGPTQEPIDPVRFISNPSSGKMGYALGRAARRRGADVILISGPSSLADPWGLKVIKVRTAEEMFKAVMAHASKSTIIIKAAAVSDWRPARLYKHKVKKNEIEPSLPLEQTPDILKELGKSKQDQVLVGFAAESRDLQENARAKLVEKNLDMVVANLVGAGDSGFGSDNNQVTLFYQDGYTEAFPLMKKDALADLLLDRVIDIKKRGMIAELNSRSI